MMAVTSFMLFLVFLVVARKALPPDQNVFLM
jgi:hypothetical protein